MNRCISRDIDFILFSIFHQKWTLDFFHKFANGWFNRELLNSNDSNDHAVSWWNVHRLSNHPILTTVSNFIAVLGAFTTPADVYENWTHRRCLESIFTNHRLPPNSVTSELINKALIYLSNLLYQSKVGWTLSIVGWSAVNRPSLKVIGESNGRSSASHVQRYGPKSFKNCRLIYNERILIAGWLCAIDITRSSPISQPVKRGMMSRHLLLAETVQHTTCCSTVASSCI
jgi:hypothetical protein